MLWFEWPKRMAAACVISMALPLSGAAETLYKYVDADGRVTLSDRPPRPGEKATLIQIDPNTNSLPSPQKTRVGDDGTKPVSAAPTKSQRDLLVAEIDAAKAQLAAAIKAREEGDAPLESERQIVVHSRAVTGADGRVRQVPTGQNSVLTNDAYRERIAALDAAIDAAKQALVAAEERLGRESK